MNNESTLFKSYFPSMTLLNGGAKSGFKKVEKVNIKPRLFHFHGDKKKIHVMERPLNLKNLDSSDVFILETNEMIYQWNGRSCNMSEKYQAMQFCLQLRDKRNGKVKGETLDDGDIEEDHIFYTFFSDENPVVEAEVPVEQGIEKKLLRLSDASGTMEIMEVATDSDITADKLDSDDIFILDKPECCYVWMGKGSNADERKSWPVFTNRYLSGTGNPLKHISVVKEGKEPKKFFA